MKRFKNIVYFVDDRVENRVALERAVTLAQCNRARLTVLGVLQHLPRDLQLFLAATLPANLQNFALKELRNQLALLVKPLRLKGQQIELVVRYGTPHIEVIRDVIEHNRDLLMWTAAGSSGLRAQLFGSTTMHLMRKCPCPLWAFKPGMERPFRRILAAVDPDPGDGQKLALAAKIIALAAALARSEGSELWIVHVWNVYKEDMVKQWAERVRPPGVDLENIVRAMAATHRRWLGGLVETCDLPGRGVQVKVLKGEPAQVINALAAQRSAELIVMGTAGRSGLDGLLIGNTAETVLSHVRCSVLAVKPEGFVSPVRLGPARRRD